MAPGLHLEILLVELPVCEDCSPRLYCQLSKCDINNSINMTLCECVCVCDYLVLSTPSVPANLLGALHGPVT